MAIEYDKLKDSRIIYTSDQLRNVFTRLVETTRVNLYDLEVNAE